MKALRTDVVSLCESLGFKTAGKWNKARMAEKLLSIAETAGEGNLPDVEDPEQAKLLADIVEAGGKVEVYQDAIPEGDEVPVTTVTGETVPVKVPKPQKLPKEKKPPKEKAGVDEFGNRLGTKQAAFCVLLDKTPRTMAELCEATGFKQQNGTFCRLVKEGKIARTEKGYIKA